MTGSIGPARPPSGGAGDGGASPAPPWHLFAVLFASTAAVVGVIWDISWHRTIGRDSFLTPAHLCIYLSGIVAGISCGWVVLRTTFAGTPAERATGVRFWGFRGPLGAWVCIWGALAMIVSAPFDNWWHNAYGLDVKVLSPPHMVLALGFTAIQLGALFMALARQNRGEEAGGALAPWMVAYASGMLVTNASIMGFEQYAFPNDAHNGTYYTAAAIGFPLFLVGGARASALRYPATAAAAIYLGITTLMIWMLQLFPGQPRLAPIYDPPTHMVPPPFPLLLVVPALGIDLLMRRVGTDRDWRLAVLLGAAFVALLFVTQWFFAQFLVSPSSESFVFGTGRWNYNSRPGPWRYEFWNVDADPVTPTKLAIAALIAIALARVGLAWGGWMARVKR